MANTNYFKYICKKYLVKEGSFVKDITFLMLHLNYGGIEKQVSTLANELAKFKDRYTINIVSVYKINDEPFYELDPNIKIKYLMDRGPNKAEIKHALKTFNIFRLIIELFKGLNIVISKYSLMKKEIENLNTDIIVSSRIEFSKYIKRKDTLNISQEHSYIDSPSYIKKVRKSFRYIDYLVVMTEGAQKKYEQWLKYVDNAPKVVCIPNMIEDTQDDEICDISSKNIVSVGRLEKVKDFESLVDVFNIVLKHYPDYKLNIVGEGHDRKNIERKIRNYNLEDKVIFKGRLNSEQVKQEMLKSCLFVLTSKSESFSLVLCEAMSLGLPCVSFDVDMGPREIIKENNTGFLIKNRNEERMAKRIIQLISNKDLSYEFSKEAQLASNDFFAENMVKKWQILFLMKKHVERKLDFNI